TQFIRVKRSGLTLTDAESVEFKPLLLKAIEASKDQKLKALFKGLKNSGDFEIESHFVEGSDLYLGFKSPRGASQQSLVLIVHGFETIFRSKTLEASQLAPSQWIDFGKSVGAPHRLSDLIQINGTLFATTVCDAEDCGGVWKLQKAKREGDLLIAEELRFYEGLRPEGLAFNPADSSLFVTFDQKSETPRFARLPIETPVPGTQQIEAATAHVR
ncbi:MAG: hypothetical protein KF789_09300, partial [Bdellovibrionaceae bacterium]|nr:hypothetical protein [Pseudobdellovibrionaceae bacterium]